MTFRFHTCLAETCWFNEQTQG